MKLLLFCCLSVAILCLCCCYAPCRCSLIPGQIGFSMEGMTRFNELYDIVKEDRACPKAKEMEESFRMHCRTLAGKHCPNGNSTTVGELDGNNAAQGDTEVEVLIKNKNKLKSIINVLPL